MLSGVRVVDLTGWIAGPIAARTLADFGADVIKIEEPGAELPAWFPNMHIETNRGKRHVLVDVKHPAGREVLLRLVKSCDVVVENAKRGVWEQYGLGFVDLLEVNPNLIYVSVRAYGANGPWERWGGFEANAQGFAGIGARITQSEDDPPLTFMGAGAINDYGAPCLTVPPMLLALAQPRHLRKPMWIESALEYSATLYQSADLMSMEGYSLAEKVRPGALGRTITSRLWPAFDGWIYAAFESEGMLGRFCGALGGIEQDELEASEESIERLTRQLPCESLISTAAAVGGIGMKLSTHEEVKRMLQKDGSYYETQEPEWGSVGRVGPQVAFSAFLSELRPAPGWGQHTREVLAEIGLSETQIQALIDCGAAQ